MSAEARVLQMERTLYDNIAGFWHPRCLDRQHGGYLIHFGERGEPSGQTAKGLVSQTRMLWLFSRLARFGYRPPEMLEAAELGYRFLIERMCDRVYGGLYWETDSAGSRVLEPQKHLYGQAFALFALSEYYLASGRKEVLEDAVQLFELLEARAHDPQYGGYRESFDQRWTLHPPGERCVLGQTGLKLMNTHLHLLEALTACWCVSRLSLVRERLLELITIQSRRVVRQPLCACSDKHRPDWTPILDGKNSRVSHGHNLENVSLLIEANEAAGLPNSLSVDLYRGLFAYSMKYGWDQRDGGFYESGAFNRPADRREKIWWVQAEGLLAALKMYRLTREPQYLAVFERTWDFLNRCQIDWDHGEWHARIGPRGPRREGKGDSWKEGYHNGRALIECLEILHDLGPQVRNSP